MTDNYLIKKLFHISSKFPKTLAIDEEPSFYSYEDFAYMVLNLTKKF